MKIKSPNKDYTGVSASVPFCNGVGETEDPYLRERGKACKRKEHFEMR